VITTITQIIPHKDDGPCDFVSPRWDVNTYKHPGLKSFSSLTPMHALPHPIAAYTHLKYMAPLMPDGLELLKKLLVRVHRPRGGLHSDQVGANGPRGVPPECKCAWTETCILRTGEVGAFNLKPVPPYLLQTQATVLIFSSC